MKLGSIANHLAFQVHLTWRAARKALLAEVGKSDRPVARGSYSVPILIGLNPDITPMQLATGLHLDASKVALFLRDLEKDGLVLRQKCEYDRRVVKLRLTEKGEAFVKEAMEASAVLERPFENALDADEKAELIRLLTKVRANLG